MPPRTFLDRKVMPKVSRCQRRLLTGSFCMGAISRRIAPSHSPEERDLTMKRTDVSSYSSCSRGFWQIPVRDKNIELSGLLGVSRRGEDQFLSVPREHREAVEPGVISNALQSGAIGVNQVKRKTSP